MPGLKTLTPEKFRRQLAGLEDDRASQVFDRDSFSQHSCDLVVALALVFNRAKLDPKTLWTRIDSAIEAGLSAANGSDTQALIDAACAHVMAAPNAVVSEEFATRIKPILELDDDAAYAFFRHLAGSRYTVIVFGQQAWEERKELRKTAEALAAETQKLEEEGGE